MTPSMTSVGYSRDLSLGGSDISFIGTPFKQQPDFLSKPYLLNNNNNSTFWPPTFERFCARHYNPKLCDIHAN